MENLSKNIEELRERVVKTRGLLDIDGKKTEAKELKIKMNKPGFWDDQNRAIEISREVEELDKEILQWEDLSREIRDLEELAAVAEKEKEEALRFVGAHPEQAFDFEGNNNLEDGLNINYKNLFDRYNRLEFMVMFSGKYDANNAIISIHAGTGGVDAQDWAEILERMLLRFAEKKNWRAELVERTAGNEAGIKSVMYNIRGRWAYGYLKSESGVHRLVRISPFDAEAMRHTSFALVEVIPELPETMELEISESDLKIDVYRSSGPGGQGVNTTDSAVRITHLPSKIVVTCQNERSQHQNKETAMKILKSKLFKIEEEKKEAKELKLRGEAQKAQWGNQIRSYVMQPYKMVKDHRTDHETQDIDAVLNGGLEEFMEAYLQRSKK
ncbi:MAG: peptide chain release factor 2 [Patescibacteria group bacterium]|nr:peptide chain release factor 2 [Patescibacteria group bacterium]